MKPFGVFDSADLPTSAVKQFCTASDFSEPWTCIPFEFQLCAESQHLQLRLRAQITALLLCIEPQQSSTDLPCDGSTFDLANDANVVKGPAKRPPRRIELLKQGAVLCRNGIEFGGIE